ncbi:MAG TPA: glycosyltransferase family 2 protein [Terriglobia bacterium]|nr:glycosyltransferase family 2 protein [Terriglobia bacterium]
MNDAVRKKEPAGSTGVEHICVCICAYKRPHLLARLLEALKAQETDGLFTYSIVVVDNDHRRSAEAAVSAFSAAAPVPVRYDVEPHQNISLARNRSVEDAEGDYVAFIDDDEFPDKYWLLTLLNVCKTYGVDGVLGPVKRHFDARPPEWILKGDFFERPVHATGERLKPHDGRTSNALVKMTLVQNGEQPFRPQFRGGEDKDFFMRVIEKGRSFVWSSDAVVYEVVPPSRWRRKYMLRRALQRGSVTLMQPGFGARAVMLSIIAVPAYLAVLPFALASGQHRFMTVMIRLCNHLGKLLALLRIHPIKEHYVME